MQTHCDQCFTAYHLPEKNTRPVGCPYCGFVNDGKAKANGHGPDQSKTMLNFLAGEMKGEVSEVKRLINGKLPSLSPGHEILVEILEGDKKGQKFAVRKPKISVGRKGSDIELSDAEVSRRHCVVAVFADTVILRDLGSSNGTMVNEFLVKEVVLKNRDRIQVGGTVISISLRNIAEVH